jgi:DNA segregation ATPase FtsK/SpoIIIE, S-DNA-T family
MFSEQGFFYLSRRPMSQRLRLEQQADRIEAVLAQHKVPAQVNGGTATPGLARFHLTVGPQVRLSRIAGLAEELALALGAASCHIRRFRDVIEVEVARDRKGSISLSQLCETMGRVPSATAVLGLDGGGQPLLLRLSSPSVAHVLICGTTGSGKTALLRTMLVSLARFNRPSELGLIMIDPKRRGATALAGLPHLLRPAAGTADEAAGLLAQLVREMERRDANGFSRPRIVIAIDELADLLQTGAGEVQAPLTRLLQRGREAGIHVLACTQKPSAEVLSGVIRANFPTRLVGKVTSASDARIASGIAGTGAEKLSGCGEFLLIASGQTIRFQAAWLSPGDLAPACAVAVA